MITPTEKQWEIFKLFYGRHLKRITEFGDVGKAIKDDDYRWIYSIGGKGSAKTHGAVICLLPLFFNPYFKGSRILMARETLRDLENTLLKDFLNLLNSVGVDLKQLMHDKSRQVISYLPNEVELYYMSLTDKDSGFMKVRSYEFNVVIIDEADRITEQAFNEVSERMRLRHKFVRGMVISNPTTQQHWLYKSAEKNEKLGIAKIVHSSTYDNFIYMKIPKDELLSKARQYENYYVIGTTRYEVVGEENNLLTVKRFNIAHSYLVELEAKPTAYRLVMLNGQWGAYDIGDGLYSDSFTHENIKEYGLIKPYIPYDMQFIVAFDWGFRRPAYVLIGIDYMDNIYILDEMLGEGISTLRFVDEVLKRLQNKFRLTKHDVMFVGDIAGRQREQATGNTIVGQIEREYGLRILTRKTPIEHSVNYIKVLLEKKKLYVTDTCQISLQMFLGSMKQDEYGRPIKDGYYEHIHDAIRYGIWNAKLNAGLGLKAVAPDY